MEKFFQLPQEVLSDLDVLDQLAARLDGENNGVVLRDEDGNLDLTGATYQGHVIVAGPDHLNKVLLSSGGIVEVRPKETVNGVVREWFHVRW